MSIFSFRIAKPCASADRITGSAVTSGSGLERELRDNLDLCTGSPALANEVHIAAVITTRGRSGR
jgi:hypothetical protein